jgi:hypothetical protein
MVSNPRHLRCTHALAQTYDEFFKTLVPKDKDEPIQTRFEGTNSITVNAPWYKEIITLGNGHWSWTRNGIMETRGLVDQEVTQIAVE